MSGVTRGSAGTRAGRWWQKWRFHLNALAILVPLAAFPAFYQSARMFSGEQGIGARPPVEVQTGPFALRLIEFDDLAPHDAGVAGVRKSFTLALCQGCEARIRAVHLRLGEPRSLRAAGSLFSGTPGRMFADIALPDSARSTDQLWLTVEEWNGTVHKAGVDIDAISPATATWLRTTRKTR